ncbi:MAG: DUF4123 domain-containing protein [Acidobacteria bacterium]|nr:DUF4123 domain-containing protein [Acidobacteriota bacterium]
MTTVDAVRELLWNPRGADQVFDVYALLDGARDPRIVPMLRRSGLFHRCLYAGKLPEDFLLASPHLVLLSATAPFTRELLEQGWGRSWGIFLRSVAGLDALQTHFRKFLQVQDEEGRSFFFRFFDPRVLSAFLPTCTPHQLEEFFGPVSRFLVETSVGAVLNDYYVVLERLEHRRYPVPPRPVPAPGPEAEGAAHVL